ncbi:MAG: hypothetical protein ABSF50_18155 [Burkholderiaceae bacterium]
MGTFATQPLHRALERNLTSVTSDLLPLSDFVCVVFIAFFSRLLAVHWLARLGIDSNLALAFEHGAMIAAVLAPFILYDRRFGSLASNGKLFALVRSHLVRFTAFTSMILALGSISHALDLVPYRWLFLWLGMSLLLTSLTRIVAYQFVRHLQRKGVLTEVIAVVGAGKVADRLVHALLKACPASVELIGVFDDKVIGAEPSMVHSRGNLADLIELGKTQKIDWILLTLPPTAEERLLAIVKRLSFVSAHWTVPAARGPRGPPSHHRLRRRCLACQPPRRSAHSTD